MNTNKKLNMTMLCDFYELTMGNGYFKAGYKDRITHFDLFFRSVPDKGGYAIAAGCGLSGTHKRYSALKIYVANSTPTSILLFSEGDKRPCLLPHS